MPTRASDSFKFHDGTKTLYGAGSRLTPESTTALHHGTVVHARIDSSCSSRREPDFGSEGRGFESLRARQHHNM